MEDGEAVQEGESGGGLTSSVRWVEEKAEIARGWCEISVGVRI